MEKWLYGPFNFNGTLSLGSHSVVVEFSAGIDSDGSACVTLVRFQRSSANRFISELWDVPGTRFPLFSLAGNSADGQSFGTDNLIITSLGHEFSDQVDTMCPVVACTFSNFTKLQQREGPPAVKRWLNGFENFVPLSASTPFGTLSMAGAHRPDRDAMSGEILLTMDSVEPFEEWEKKADELLDWVTLVMSFAAAKRLSFPVMEIFQDERLLIEVYDRSIAPSTGLRPFASIDQRAIFDCAIASYFDPKVTIRNLDYAIEWFCMRAVHAESNLVFAMTVLENLVDSNLSNSDKAILPKAKFSELKQKMLEFVGQQIASYFSGDDAQQAALEDYSDKFLDLNRKTLLQKVHLLAERWMVGLDGIDDAHIRAAKSCRDKIVHRGHYRTPTEGERDLHDHVLLVRELIVRFVLTALRFQGRYYTYMEGYRERNMPPLII